MEINITKKYAIVLDRNSVGDTNKYNFFERKMTNCTVGFRDISNIGIFVPFIAYDELKKHIRNSKNSSKEIKSNYQKNSISESDIKKIYIDNVRLLDEIITNKEIKTYNCTKYINLEKTTN